VLATSTAKEGIVLASSQDGSDAGARRHGSSELTITCCTATKSPPRRRTGRQPTTDRLRRHDADARLPHHGSRSRTGRRGPPAATASAFDDRLQARTIAAGDRENVAGERTQRRYQCPVRRGDSVGSVAQAKLQIRQQRSAAHSCSQGTVQRDWSRSPNPVTLWEALLPGCQPEPPLRSSRSRSGRLGLLSTALSRGTVIEAKITQEPGAAQARGAISAWTWKRVSGDRFGDLYSSFSTMRDSLRRRSVSWGCLGRSAGGSEAEAGRVRARRALTMESAPTAASPPT